MGMDAEATAKLFLEQNAGQRAARENYDENGEHILPSPSHAQKATQFRQEIQQRCKRYHAWCEFLTHAGAYRFVLFDPVTNKWVFNEIVPEHEFPSDELIAQIMLIAK